MKSFFQQRNSLQLLMITGLVSMLFSRCVSVDAINASPTRIGIGFRASPGVQLGEGRTSAHTVLGYSRIAFKGGGGHNNIWQYGLQLRHAVEKTSPEGMWIGGEISYLHISNKYDNNSSFKQTAPAFTVGGMTGYRFLAGKIPMSIYAAPAYLSRGKFKTNGTTSGEGSSGFFIRMGLDIHLFSLIHKKGR